MNALQIAKLDLFEKRMVFAAAGILGLLFLIAPFPAGMGGIKPAENRAAAALVIGGLFMVAMALIQGATMIATDLKERRLGFFFNLPLTATALWSGKVLGGILLMIFIGVLSMIPSVLGGTAKGGINAWLDFTKAFGVYLALCTTLMLLAHALAITSRARTGWVLLVLGLLALWVGVLRLAVIRLVMFSPDWSPERFFLAVLGSLGLTLAISGWVQVTQGRLDLRRSARVLALSLTAGTLLSLAGLQGYVVKRSRVSPADLDWMWGGVAPAQGDWVALTGHLASEKRPSFLLFNTVTGKFLATDRMVHSVSFSEDGRRAAWIRSTPGLQGYVCEVVWADLTQAEPIPKPTGILLEDPFVARQLSLSQDGSKLAFIESGGTLKVHALDTGLLLASTRLPAGGDGECFFVAANNLRYYCRNGDRLEIGELDLRTLKITMTGHLTNVNPWGLRGYAAATERMLVRTKAEEIQYCEARTGNILATFPPTKDGFHQSLSFLEDGSLVMGGVMEGKPFLKLLDDSGNPLRTLDLASPQTIAKEPKGVTLLAQLSKKRLLVRLWGKGNNPGGHPCLEVDLGSGHIETVNQGDPLLFSSGFGERTTLPANGRLYRKGQDLIRVEADGREKVLFTFRTKGEGI